MVNRLEENSSPKRVAEWLVKIFNQRILEQSYKAAGKIKEVLEQAKDLDKEEAERMLEMAVRQEFERALLKTVEGDTLSQISTKLTSELKQLKQNTAVDYGKHGIYMPDAELVIYDPKTHLPIAIISKMTDNPLHKRIKEVEPWEKAIRQNPTTAKVKVFSPNMAVKGKTWHDFILAGLEYADCEIEDIHSASIPQSALDDVVDFDKYPSVLVWTKYAVFFLVRNGVDSPYLYPAPLESDGENYIYENRYESN